MSRELINTETLHFFRTITDEVIELFYDDGKGITIPENLTHSTLLKKYVIDDSILTYYHYPTRFLLTDDEVEGIREYRYIENAATLSKPYNVVAFGAYVLRNSFFWKLDAILNSREESKPRLKGKIPKYLDDLQPYFRDYSEGFKMGFDNFDEDEVKPFITLLADKTDYIKKVFDYVVLPKKDFFNCRWGDGLGFHANHQREVQKAYEDGKREGYFYKAWSIILSNSDNFAPLFQELKEIDKPQQHSKLDVQPQPDIMKTEKISMALAKYGFYSLPMVAELSTDSQEDLFKKLAENKLPYAVAMFDYLGFPKHLKSNYCSTQTEMFKVIAEVFDSAVFRAVKGNFNSLNPNSNEYKFRYTAYQHKDSVHKYYTSLTKGL